MFLFLMSVYSSSARLASCKRSVQPSLLHAKKASKYSNFRLNPRSFVRVLQNASTHRVSRSQTQTCMIIHLAWRLQAKCSVQHARNPSLYLHHLGVADRYAALASCLLLVAETQIFPQYGHSVVTPVPNLYVCEQSMAHTQIRLTVEKQERRPAETCSCAVSVITRRRPSANKQTR